MPPIAMTSLLPANGRIEGVAGSSPRERRSKSDAVDPPIGQLQTCLSAIRSVTPQALVAFSHAALFSPALSTLVTAMTEGFLPVFLGLTLATL
jgi:hypothetical protein